MGKKGEKKYRRESESGKGGIALSPPQSTIFGVSRRFLPFNPLRSLVPGYNIRNTQNVNQALKGTMSHYHNNKLKRVFASIKFQKKWSSFVI